MKFVTLNYPQLEINSKLREKIKWTFPWVKNNSKVVLDGPTSRFVYTIYDPENELQDLFDEVSTLITEEDDLRDLMWDTVVSVIDEDGLDHEEPLGVLRPYWHSNPGIRNEWQWECQHCGYRSANRDEREVWDYMSLGAKEGQCFSCRRHDPDHINEFCQEECCELNFTIGNF